MNDVRWGIIGFGEVGSTFAQHLSEAGLPIGVFDLVLLAEPLPEQVRSRLAGLAIEVASGTPSLVLASDITLSLVTPAAAERVATDAAGAGGSGLFLDFNSISPAEKQSLSILFPNGRYVDGAILGSIAAEASGS